MSAYYSIAPPGVQQKIFEIVEMTVRVQLSPNPSRAGPACAYFRYFARFFMESRSDFCEKAAQADEKSEVYNPHTGIIKDCLNKNINKIKINFSLDFNKIK